MEPNTQPLSLEDAAASASEVAHISADMSATAATAGLRMTQNGVDARTVNTVLITSAIFVLAEQIAYGSEPGYESNMLDESVKQLEHLLEYYANERDSLKGADNQEAA